ncbi:hypothetical protein DEI92_08350 [Curtobacterium sp. MCBD17_034]|uniref:glycoside hydrolase family 172 protein n=1 Tax=unclassified Curtobacterium TaxID=257496 RepID=UPI000DA828A4|nr:MULTISPECIES: glycoside hydrolase family 172 protein [unclassified Curtobacterium]PZF60350.1 hypothetical protein DEI92_08350 [Curtobacterium sp. MCBD17_034]PZM35035.1 hypothetical protein DEI90_06335 [Curtobacterium sp. MCBD17_031]
MSFSWDTVLSAPKRIESRSINAENPTGERGAGARTPSALGTGRKGTAFVPIAAGETITLADIVGPGTIRHIWITVPDRTDGGAFVLRNLVLRAYWDGESAPSVEVPLGDFFCNGFGARALVTSIPIVVAPTGGMNSYFPMPFRESARITLESEHPDEIGAVFFQIDYTVGDEHPDDLARFHAQWRRSNATTALGEDHVILDGVAGRGHYVGTYVALSQLERYWWGEGEVKFYLDGDDEFPTLCSTGLEDYAGGAWAFQDELREHPDPNPLPFSAPYFGYPHVSRVDESKGSPFWQAMPPSHALYRWHLPDPIAFRERLRVTLQQIGAAEHGLFERADDISTTAYWYQVEPHAAYPTFPDASARRPR